jgi:hypothetical protein
MITLLKIMIEFIYLDQAYILNLPRKRDKGPIFPVYKVPWFMDGVKDILGRFLLSGVHPFWRESAIIYSFFFFRSKKEGFWSFLRLDGVGDNRFQFNW